MEAINRKVDELGRVVLPAELRQLLKVKEKDEVTLTASGESVIITKARPSCHLCGNIDDLAPIDNKHVCRNCSARLKEVFGNK